ncbi:MAG: Hsp70 family protein, partial [Actinobacteria bacterium]|nr:Hsp70 family protein [Actinomycetota bacterium]
GQTKLDKLREAAVAAGFAHADLMPEPVGAAVYFADEQLGHGRQVAVYDLGGGTFDTAVLLRTSEGFDVVGRPGGREDLGGEDFDDRMYRYLAAQLDADQRQTLTAADADLRWQRAHHDFRREVRRAKERLSKYPDATVRSPVPGTPDLRVSRTEFESLIRDDVLATIDELERTISAAGQSADALAAIYLAGGSSRIPLVTTLLEDRFGRPPSVLGDPKAVIALGAARAHPHPSPRRPDLTDRAADRIRSEGNPQPIPSDPARLDQVVVRAAPPARPGPTVSRPLRVDPPAASLSQRAASNRAAIPPARPLPESARARDTAAAAVTGVIAGSGVLGATANVLLVLDATKTGAVAGIRMAIGLGVVAWLLVAAGFGTASASFLGLMPDRRSGLRAAAVVVGAGFGLGFLSEAASALEYASQGARGTFVAAHGAYGICELLAAVAVGAAAVAVARSGSGHAARAAARLANACSVAGASLLMFAAASILYLVTYTSTSARAAISGGLGLQIAGGALAAGGAFIAATAFLSDENRSGATRRQVLAAGACVAALGFGIVALGSGMQAAVAGAGGASSRTIVSDWLLTGQQICWVIALCAGAIGTGRRI